jgi:hypothetical protein
MLFTHVAPRTKSQGLPIGGPLFRKKSMLFIHIAPRTKSQGLPIDGPLFSKKSMHFTHVAPRIKSKWLLIGGLLLSKNLYFLHAYHHVQKARGSRLAVPYSAKKMLFIHVAPRTKSKGAPDERSTHLLFHSARASLCTKSKGLHRYVL